MNNLRWTLIYHIGPSIFAKAHHCRRQNNACCWGPASCATRNMERLTAWVWTDDLNGKHIWLVVWNMNFIFHFIYGMSSFPLTNSIMFQRGRLRPPTRYNRGQLFDAFSSGLMTLMERTCHKSHKTWRPAARRFKKTPQIISSLNLDRLGMENSLRTGTWTIYSNDLWRFTY